MTLASIRITWKQGSWLLRPTVHLKQKFIVRSHLFQNTNCEENAFQRGHIQIIEFITFKRQAFQGVTLTWKYVHRISRISAGYQRYSKRISRGNLPNIIEITDRFQQSIKKYLLYFTYLNISQTSVNSNQRVKNWKIAEYRYVLIKSNSLTSQISTGYQPNIKAFCTPDIMSFHPLSKRSLFLFRTKH